MKILGVTLCSCCKNTVPRPGQRYCHDCHAWINRCTRKPYRDFTPEQKRKADARSNACQAVRRGTMKRQPCEIPGCRSRAEKHHEDYSRPFDVHWLCTKHHLETHGKECHRVPKHMSAPPPASKDRSDRTPTG